MSYVVQTRGPGNPGGQGEVDGTGDDLVDLLKELSRDTVELLRSELELVRAEMTEKFDHLKGQVTETAGSARREMEGAKADLTMAGRSAGMGAGMFAAAGVVGLGAFALLTAALVAGLTEVLSLWAAALTVGFVYAGLAGGLILRANQKLRAAGKPIPHTVNRLRALFAGSAHELQQELTSVPGEATESLRTAKEQVQEAWKRGRSGSGPETAR